jgi:hypothetical protein
MVRAKQPERPIQWIEEGRRLLKQEAAFHSTLRVEKPVDIVDKHRINNQQAHGKTSDSNRDSYWC